MGKCILTTQNYQFPNGDEYSLNQHYLLLFSACKNHNFSKIQDQGKENLEKYNASRPGSG